MANAREELGEAVFIKESNPEKLTITFGAVLGDKVELVTLGYSGIRGLKN